MMMLPTFDLFGIMLMCAHEDLLDMEDAIRVSVAGISIFVSMGSLRGHAWWHSRRMCFCVMKIWQITHNPLEPVWIFQSFYEFNLGIADGYNEYCFEGNDPLTEDLTTEGSWKALIQFRRWQREHDFKVGPYANEQGALLWGP